MLDAGPAPADGPTVLAFNVTGAKPMTHGTNGVKLVITRDPHHQADLTLEEAVAQMASIAPAVEVIEAGRNPDTSAGAVISSLDPVTPGPPAHAAASAAGASNPWPNKTPAGTRWTLRHRDKNTMMLRIDLGLQQVASLIVPPEWETADPGRFEAMVDRLRIVLRERFPLESALFMFWRDAKLSRIQMP